MSFNVSTVIGSGTIPFTRGILPPSQRGSQTGGEGVRTGAQVVLANPEDLNSVDAFATSGVSIGTIPVQIWGPTINYLLPRQRTLMLQNLGPGQLFIGPNSQSVIAPSGMQLTTIAVSPPGAKIVLPLLHNVEVWGRSDIPTEIQILAY